MPGFTVVRCTQFAGKFDEALESSWVSPSYETADEAQDIILKLIAAQKSGEISDRDCYWDIWELGPTCGRR